MMGSTPSSFAINCHGFETDVPEREQEGMDDETDGLADLERRVGRAFPPR